MRGFTRLEKLTCQYPYCGLYVYNPDKKADYRTSVKPGVFEVSQVFNKTRYADSDSQPDNSWGMQASISWYDHEPPSYILYAVKIKLTSAEQPDVQSLTCSRKWATYGDYYPTLADIRRALGEMMEFKIDPI